MSLDNQVKIRLDVPDTNQKIIRSCVGIKQGDKQFIVDSPINGNAFPEYETDQERLESLLVQIMNYTSKLISVDELTGKAYYETDEKPSQLYMYRLRGTDAINRHHCAGSVNYHEDSKHMLLWLELMMWNQHKIIPSEYHNLKDINVTIERSNGDIEEGYIKDSPIRWSNTSQEFSIAVLLEGDLEKSIIFSKLIELNPELELLVSIPSIEGKDLPEWVIGEYKSWIEKINNYLKWDDNMLKIEYK